MDSTFLVVLILLIVIPWGRIIQWLLRLIARRHIRKTQQAYEEMFRQAERHAQETSRANRRGGWSTPHRQQSKTYSADEGEYVSYEEVDVTASQSTETEGPAYDQTEYKSTSATRISDAEWEDL